MKRFILTMGMLLAVMLGCIICANAWEVFEVPEAQGRMNLMVVGGSATTTAPADPCSCATGTYVACFTSDHATANDYICYNSGAGALDADDNESVTCAADANCEDGDCCEVSANQDYFTWDNDSERLCPKATGTIWASIYFDQVSDPDTVPIIVEAYWQYNDKLYIYVDGDTLGGKYVQGGTDYVTTETDVDISMQTWHRVAFTWDATGGANSVCVQLDANGWDCDAADFSAISAGALDRFTLFERDCGGVHDDNLFIDNLTVHSGFQTADPGTP